MSTGLITPRDAIATDPPARHELAAPDPRAHVHTVIRLLLQRTTGVERRRERRYPFPHLVTLVPVAPDGAHLNNETIVVVGKQLSVGGLSFYHRQPIPYRRAVVVFEVGSHRTALLMDLNWCRFARRGWYENGGRFLQAASTQMAQARSTDEVHGWPAEYSSPTKKIT